MWRSKKVLVIAVLTALIVAGGIGGAVLAADNGEESQPEAKPESPLARVGEIYQQKTGTTLDLEALQESFTDAMKERRTNALQDRLQKLVAEGEITQAEADEYLQWWQVRPDVAVGFGPRAFGRFRGMCRLGAPVE